MRRVCAVGARGGLSFSKEIVAFLLGRKSDWGREIFIPLEPFMENSHHTFRHFQIFEPTESRIAKAGMWSRETSSGVLMEWGVQGRS